MKKGRIFTRSILLIGFISLFNDISSEMLYPVLPVYLRSIGYTAIWIGLLEGAAEAMSGFSKMYFGKLSDKHGHRMPFVRLGYFISALSKSALVLFAQPLWVLCCRLSDKLGKGIRTGARDAVLSDECSPEHRGKVFGFHRGMDTLGAAIGPVFALLWLWVNPGSYKTLFLFALFPALTAVGFAYLIKEKDAQPLPGPGAKKIKSFFGYWKHSSDDFRKLSAGLLFFALFNSSDLFLLLMARQHGLSDQGLILAYIFYNLVYALGSYPFGWIGDKWGMKFSFCTGLLLFAVTYAGMALTTGPTAVFILFFIYGLYAAATDGVSKAWASKLIPANQSATGLGFLAGCTSIAAVAASTWTGFVWEFAGASVALMLSGAGAAVAMAYLYLVPQSRAKDN
ncbi:MAG: MFS transporter [Bacteroidia bacterium]